MCESDLRECTGSDGHNYGCFHRLRKRSACDPSSWRGRFRCFRASGLPGWEELAVPLLQESGSVTDDDAAWRLVEREDPLLVAEAARNSLGGGWDQQVRAAL